MASRKRGLGRGLDALLRKSPDAVESEASPETTGTHVSEMAIADLEPNEYQPRTTFLEAELEELAASIRAQGIIQPLVVSPLGNGRYAIVAGERRWRAARLAGLERVPVHIREVESNEELLQLALVENLQREDLRAIEEAEAYDQLRESFGLSQAEIGERVGKSRTAVTNTLRLLRLPDFVQDLLRAGELTAGQARPLVSLPNPKRQEELALQAVEKGLSARELEALVRAEDEEKPVKKKRKPSLDVHSRAAAERLTRALQTKVEIAKRGNRGSIRIHFHSEDELMRLYDCIVRKDAP